MTLCVNKPFAFEKYTASTIQVKVLTASPEVNTEQDRIFLCVYLVTEDRLYDNKVFLLLFVTLRPDRKTFFTVHIVFFIAITLK